MLENEVAGARHEERCFLTRTGLRDPRVHPALEIYVVAGRIWDRRVQDRVEFSSLSCSGRVLHQLQQSCDAMLADPLTISVVWA